MAKIIDSAGKGAALDATDYDSNVSTLAGKNQAITATTHTITVSDQSETIEYSNASAIAVTLPTIASVSGSNIHTDDFSVTLKNIGAGAVTATRAGTDTFDDGSTSITLSQYDVVILQTDNSLTKWNQLSDKIYDAATKSGTETLSDKTLPSPAISDASFSGTQTGFVGNISGTASNITSQGALATKDTVSNADLDASSVAASNIQTDAVGFTDEIAGSTTSDDFTFSVSSITATIQKGIFIPGAITTPSNTLVGDVNLQYFINGAWTTVKTIPISSGLETTGTKLIDIGIVVSEGISARWQWVISFGSGTTTVRMLRLY